MTSLNVTGRDVDSTLLGMIERVERVERVSSLDELRSILEQGLGPPLEPPVTLDLVGHSTKVTRLLRLGETVIDMFDPAIRTAFQAFADDRLLERRGIAALRLLGCHTASTQAGQRTMKRLSRVLGVPVFGSTKNLMKSHFGPRGFRPAFSRCLVEASRLPAGLRT